MQQKYQIIGLVIVGIAIIAGASYLFWGMPTSETTDSMQATPSPENLNEEQPLATTTLEGEVLLPTTTAPSVNSEKSENIDAEIITTQPTPTKPVVTPPVVIDTAPVKPPEVVAEGITMSVVAEHDGIDSCWVAIEGNVYDLTSYIPKHPGGKGEILAICGRDGSSLFEGQHGGESKPARVLSGYYLDVVAE